MSHVLVVANALSQAVHKGANTIVLDHNQFHQRMGPVDLVNEILAKAASFEGTSLLVLNGSALQLNLEMVYRLVISGLVVVLFRSQNFCFYLGCGTRKA